VAVTDSLVRYVAYWPKLLAVLVLQSLSPRRGPSLGLCPAEGPKAASPGVALAAGVPLQGALLTLQEHGSILYRALLPMPMW
jgi:hypothetical protein